MKNILVSLIVIATWTAHWSEFVTCDINKPKTDPYTGTSMAIRFEYAVACFENHESKMSKEFESLEGYEKFKAGCSTEPVAMGRWCSDWEVKEMTKGDGGE